MDTKNLAVAIVFQNQGIILFADGRIVHPNVNPALSARQEEVVREIAANVGVIAAASGIRDAAVRQQIDAIATKAIEARTAELAHK